MSINRPQTVIVGNLTDDPELRFISNGDAVCKFRVLQTPRKLDRATNEWKDGDPFGMNVTVWRETAEHVAETLKRGMRVIVVGELTQRTYEDREGVKRTVVEMDVDAVGPDLRYATATVAKATKGSGGGGGNASRSGGASVNDDPWGGASTSRPAAAQAQSGPPANANEQRAAQAAEPAAASPW
jgi:single-strand DNA-binding protein